MSVQVVDPRQLRKLRIQLGITQSELARSADVSQSMVAKVESGQVDPSFTTMKALSEALHKHIKTEGRKVSDVMSKPVLSIQVSTPLAECINLLRDHSLSQVPIYSGPRLVGSISDRHIVSVLSSTDDPKATLARPVSRYLEASFPTVDTDTPLDALYSLFNFVPAVLVTSAEKVVGIVTKIDLISAGTK